MEKLLLILESWIKNIDKEIAIGDDSYNFNVIETFSNEDLVKFEIENKIVLPKQYRDFLLRFGSVELFLSDYSAGIEILSPYNVKSCSKSIFCNYGRDPYPNLFIPVNISSVGWFGGFDLTTKDGNNFAIFFPDIPPELWIEEATFITFNDWLKKVIDSNGDNLF